MDRNHAWHVCLHFQLHITVWNNSPNVICQYSSQTTCLLIYLCIHHIHYIHRSWIWGHQWVRRVGGITNAVDMKLSKLWEMVRDWEAQGAEVHGVTKSKIRLSYWTEVNWSQMTVFKSSCKAISSLTVLPEIIYF